MAAPTFDLCALGDYCWDVLVSTPDELPRGGDTMGTVELHPGGSAANTAVWAARCGARVAFVGMVGDDRLGRLAADDLAAEGVSAHLPASGERPTGAVASFVDHTGERSMVTGVGADHLLLPSDVPGDLVGGARHFHVTGWSLFGDPPRSAAVRGVSLARAAGATVSLDPSAHQMITAIGVPEFLALTVPLGPSVLFPNRDEGAVLTGETAPGAIAATLAELYSAPLVVLKLDAGGALVWAEGAGTHVPTPKVDPVDTTGAGDSFAAGLLAGLLRGRPLADAVRLAVACGALSTRALGGTEAQPSLPEAEAVFVHP